MLALESLVIMVIVGLCIAILRHTHPSAADTLATFTPTAEYNGWAGLGFGMVFSILSYAGFEGAATLGEETHNPRRNIPIALLGTVLGSGLFFVFVAYCEVIGFGIAGVKELGQSQAPLNDLALRYATPRVAVALDLAAAASCFSGALGALSGAGRVLFAIGRGGLSPALAAVHPEHRTPGVAVSAAAVLITIVFLGWAPFAGAGNFYSYSSTIGVLCLILVYIGVGGAEVRESLRQHRPLWSALCALGPLLLLWVLYRNVYPVPEYPNNLWPYVAVVWVILAWAVTRLKPAVTSAPLPDFS
jgi:amino acid transporter